MKFVRILGAIIGWICHFFYSNKISYVLYIFKRSFITGLKRGYFKSFGRGAMIGLDVRLIKPQYIEIGNYSSICNGCEIGCSVDDNIGHLPDMVIGDCVTIGMRVHITCANRIFIGNGVVVSRQTLITDNAHGASKRVLLDIPPMSRPVSSNGPVTIEDNVWIGEKASIMPNVHIGRGAIVAANAVVTKDVPAYSVVAGIPAKVVKQL